MARKTPSDNSVIKNNLTLILLILFAFFAGYLWNRVQTLEKGGTGASQQLGAQPQGKRLTDLAGEVGLDKNKFKECLQSGKYEKKVLEQLKEGADAGIQGTPNFVFYDLETDRKIPVNGIVSLDTAKKILDDFIKGQITETPEVDFKVAEPSKANDHWRGDSKARYVLVEYSDLECPFCKQFHPTVIQLLDAYKGRLAWVYRHFPISQIHAKAQKSAEASECAFEQKGNDGFWKLVDKIFENMPNVEVN